MITYTDFDFPFLRQLLVMVDARMEHLEEIEIRGAQAYAEHYGEGKSLQEIDPTLEKLVQEVREFITESGVPLAKARSKVRNLVAALDEHNQRLKDAADERGVSPGQNDPRNFIDIRIPFPVYSVGWR
jgi:hypothetical protein